VCELITVHVPSLCLGNLAPWYESHDTIEEARACLGDIDATIELWVCGVPSWNAIGSAAADELNRRGGSCV